MVTQRFIEELIAPDILAHHLATSKEGVRRVTMRLLSIMAVAVLANSLFACASPREALLEEGATPYMLDELVTLVSGKTEPWSKGAGYYEADGTLYARWEGEDYEGTWYATAEGTICHLVADWGTKPCTEYFHKGDNVITLYKGRTATNSMDGYVNGNKLADY